ncbi:hypothetical protein EDB85DRAFT_358393 [Lactarius pseudohatsudake]|nr:hypothetical protein EDB85DRAFT_358393 [Lactarius pseudohatsudake]
MSKSVAGEFFSELDFDTNATIIPFRTLETMTSAHQILFGYPTWMSDTILSYGLGWAGFSVARHDSLYHAGGAPEVSADITIPVLNGVGVVTVANADDKQLALHDIAVAVLRKVELASCTGESIDSMPANLSAHASTRILFRTTGSRHTHEGDPSTTHELARLDLTGMYDDIGYGTPTLCNASSRSDECRSVLDDSRLADESSTDDPNTLFSSWPSVWTSHARSILPIPDGILSTLG